MTRVDVYAEIFINGEGYLIHTHAYIYEKYECKHLKYTFNRLKKSKFEYKYWLYNRFMDAYAVYFELDVIL